MKKVLHLTITSEIGGGPEHIHTLLSCLSDQIESHVGCPDGPYQARFAARVANRLCFVPYRKFSLGACYTILRYIKKNKIAIIHSHGKGAGVYGRILRFLSGVPLVHTPHGINQQKKGLTGAAYKFFERLSGGLISRIIFVSYSEREFAKSNHLWRKVASTVIPNGTHSFSSKIINNKKTEAKNQFGWTDKKVVISASRFDFQKNSIEMCQIASAVPEIHFVFLGQGENKAACEMYCREHNLQNVEFIGATSHPIDYMVAADLYLSTSRWEGLSMAILEAMSIGLPIVATNVVGNEDLVQEGENGFLYELGNVLDAKDKILASLTEQTYGRLSAASVSIHQEKYSSKRMCERTEQVYKEVIK